MITIHRFDHIRVIVTYLLHTLLQDDFKFTSLPVVTSPHVGVKGGGWRVEGGCVPIILLIFIVETSSLIDLTLPGSCSYGSLVHANDVATSEAG